MVPHAVIKLCANGSTCASHHTPWWTGRKDFSPRLGFVDKRVAPGKFSKLPHQSDLDPVVLTRLPVDLQPPTSIEDDGPLQAQGKDPAQRAQVEHLLPPLVSRTTAAGCLCDQQWGMGHLDSLHLPCAVAPTGHAADLRIRWLETRLHLLLLRVLVFVKCIKQQSLLSETVRGVSYWGCLS